MDWRRLSTRAAALAVMLAVGFWPAPESTKGQQVEKVSRVGFLAPTGSLEPFRSALRNLGYVGGKP